MFKHIIIWSSKTCHSSQKLFQLLSCKLFSKSVRKLSSSAAKREAIDLTSANVCVIGNGSEANPSSVALTCGDRTYLFNCGEGLQRFVPQYKLKVSKINNLFLTSNDWRNVSGVSGLMLTQIDSGLKNFQLFGIDLRQLIQLITAFDYKFANCSINCTDYKVDGNKPFVDNYVRITPIMVSPDSERTSVVYVCNLLPREGQLLLDKCFQLKIPAKVLPQLKAGNSVVLDNGLQVCPSEVKSPDIPEQCFLVLECSSDRVLTALLKNEELRHQLTLNRHLIECVIHMTPESVLNNNYQQILQLFEPEVNHLIVNEQNPGFGLHSMHRAINQLNYLDPKVFPLLNEQLETNKSPVTSNRFGTRLVKCQTGLQYVFRPEQIRGFGFDALEFVNIKYLKEDALKDHKLMDIRKGLEECVVQLRDEQKLLEQTVKPEPYPEVVFLGTASAQPISYRNVTSILVNISEDSSILLDCGEDTFAQMLRFYGSSQLKSIFTRMKAVFVTHMHTDHHMGLIRVITKHFEYTSKPITLFVPLVVGQWLKQYCQNFEDISHNYKAFMTTELDANRDISDSDQDIAQVLKDLRLKQLKAIPVNHCDDSVAVLLHTEATDKRILFSGDAEPNSDLLIECGQACDLLIHEATQEDARVRLARLQCHSTVSEAIDVGRRMSAKFTILTHFSQRYGKLPLIPEEFKRDPNLGIAFDFMRVSLPELSRLPLLSPALHCMYATHIDRLKERESLQKRRLVIASRASV